MTNTAEQSRTTVENMTSDVLLKEAMAHLTSLQKAEQRHNDALDQIDVEKGPVRENLNAAINEQPLPHPQVFEGWINRPKRGRKPATETNSNGKAETKPKG